MYYNNKNICANLKCAYLLRRVNIRTGRLWGSRPFWVHLHSEQNCAILHDSCLYVCISSLHVAYWLLWERWRWFVNSSLESFYIINWVAHRLVRISSYSVSQPCVVCSLFWGRWRWFVGFSCWHTGKSDREYFTRFPYVCVDSKYYSSPHVVCFFSLGKMEVVCWVLLLTYRQARQGVERKGGIDQARVGYTHIYIYTTVYYTWSVTSPASNFDCWSSSWGLCCPISLNIDLCD